MVLSWLCGLEGLYSIQWALRPFVRIFSLSWWNMFGWTTHRGRASVWVKYVRIGDAVLFGWSMSNWRTRSPLRVLTLCLSRPTLFTRAYLNQGRSITPIIAPMFILVLWAGDLEVYKKSMGKVFIQSLTINTSDSTCLHVPFGNNEPPLLVLRDNTSFH